MFPFSILSIPLHNNHSVLCIKNGVVNEYSGPRATFRRIDIDQALPFADANKNTQLA